MVFIAESVPFISHIEITIKNLRSAERIFTRETSRGKGLFLIVKTFLPKIFDAVAAYLMNSLCIANIVRSGPAQKRKDSPDAINAMNFLVIILKIFP